MVLARRALGKIKKKSVEGKRERTLRVGYLASSIASAEVAYDLDKCAVGRLRIFIAEQSSAALASTLG